MDKLQQCKAPIKLGHIHLILGCMWSSKTTALTSQLQRYLQIDKQVLVVNHVKDIRYGHDVISTHDQIKFPCLMVPCLMRLLELEQFHKADAIFIDEAQWFSDAREFCLKAAEEFGKDVILAGLNGGYKRDIFQPISELLPVCDEITHLKALCSCCKDGTEAVFTRRKPETADNPMLVGGKDLYDAVCRKHYIENQ